MPFDPLSMTLLTTATLLCLTLAWRHWPRQGLRALLRRRRKDSLDTVVAWHPEPARVLNIGELSALELARRAAPGALLLSQVPLSRFLRVPTRHSYGRWLARVGNLNADILVCDARTRVLAVIDVRCAHASERSLRRHGRMQRVLRAAGVQVLVWHEERLPTVGAARAQLSAIGVPVESTGEVQVEHVLRPQPTITPRELETLLAAGDAAIHRRSAMAESVPSDFHGLHSMPSTIR
jgi:Protein of unknown function (DUF2726)